MPRKPSITIVGAGSLGSALALALHGSGYTVQEIVSRDAAGSRKRARVLAGRIGARAVTQAQAAFEANVVWICVPDREIASSAEALAALREWKGKIGLHSSGALTSDELAPLRERGAAVASVHPMMTFVRDSAPSMAGVSFAVEGDYRAARVAGRIARDLRGEVFAIGKEVKGLYHAWGAFLSPLIIANLTLAEEVARAVGMPSRRARNTMAPILRQTLENYLRRGAAQSFSGPIVRGDVATITRHLEVLKELPAARDAYLVLARAALRNLPVGNREGLENLLRAASKT